MTRSIAMAKQKAATCTSSVSSSTELAEQNPEDTAAVKNNQIEHLAPPQTPSRRPRKRAKVRFSDPGPDLDRECSHGSDPSTGLTPAVSRTGIHDAANSSTPSVSESVSREPRTPGRRHSAPNLRGNPISMRSGIPRSPEDIRTVQYLPFHDILDARTVRRIRRTGFSEEMNNISERKRQREKQYKEKEAELAELKKELDRVRNMKGEIESASDLSSEEAIDELSKARKRVEELEMLLNRNGECLNTEYGISVDQDVSTGDEEDMGVLTDGMAIGDDGLTFSAGADPSNEFLVSTSAAHVSAQASLPDLKAEAEILLLTQELESRKQEKYQLFKEWQSLNRHGARPQVGTGDDIFRSLSPPSDLIAQVITELRVANSARSDALTATRKIFDNLKSHGLDGANTEEMVSDLRSRFRHARLELERAVPGETANANLANWAAILDALVSRIRILVNDVATCQGTISGCTDRESTLRGQFDATLFRLEELSRENDNLEKSNMELKKLVENLNESIDAFADDMLHARMKIQTLEKEAEEHESSRTSLIEALDKYRSDIITLEEIITKLEVENNLSAEKTSALERKLADEEKIRQETQSALDRCRVDVSTLGAKMQYLETHKQSAIAVLEQAAMQETERHEKELGSMNVRLGSLTTALTEAKTENETLLQNKRRLEKRVDAHQRLFSREAVQAAREHVQQTARTFAEWERMMQLLDASWESEKANDTTASNRVGFATIGSEPMTPASVNRFANVETERGRKRRRPDSGIEILMEEEEDGWSDGDAFTNRLRTDDIPSSC